MDARNLVDLEVLDIESIDLTPQSLELPAGSRQAIEAKVTTRDGRRIDDIYLIWTENDRSIVSVSSGGMVFGLTTGSTVVTAGDNQVEAGTPTQVTVLDAKDAKDQGSGLGWSESDWSGRRTPTNVTNPKGNVSKQRSLLPIR